MNQEASSNTSAARAGFYGKYRGTVVLNVDPLQIGRIQAIVPDVTGLLPGTWAMPCVPVAGLNAGFIAVPPVGSGVWIEYERGDPDYPIWVGCYWGMAAELPALSHMVPPGVPGFTLQTPLLNGLVISDGPTGIMMQSSTGATFMMNSAGILISNGKGATISMAGPTTTINAGALTVI